MANVVAVLIVIDDPDVLHVSPVLQMIDNAPVSVFSDVTPLLDDPVPVIVK
jgi:hypothetical protein